MKRIVFDMETGDPDDVFALCFITSHPDLELVGVTVTPGSNAQVGIVKHILKLTDHSHVPVGSRSPGHPKPAVSKWHYNWLGDIAPENPDGEACDVMCQVQPSIVVTGAAVTNLSKMFQKYREKGKWGSILTPRSNIRISTSVDMDKFIEVLTTT